MLKLLRRIGWYFSRRRYEAELNDELRFHESLAQADAVARGTPRHEAASLVRRRLHHGGSAMGARAFLLVYLKEGVAVALLSNTEANFGEPEALAFARLVLEH